MIINFPKTLSEIFKEIDEESIIDGAVNTNEEKFKAFCEALQNINEYGKLHEKKMEILCDDPRVHYYNHTLLIKFDTSTFEDKDADLFRAIIKPFDSIDFFVNKDGNVEVLLLMEGIYSEVN